MYKRITLIAISLLSCIVLGARQKSVTLSDSDGLLGCSVKCIHQDSKGYIWFGTWNGLSRYDGSNFMNLTSEPGNCSTIHDNVVDDIVEDADGNLWILNEGGISKVSESGNSIVSYDFNTGRSDHNSFKSFDKNGNGPLLCSIMGWGLGRFDEKTSSIVPVNLSGISTSDLYYVVCNSDSTFIVQNTGGSVFEYGILKSNDGAFNVSAPARLLEGESIQMTKRLGDQVMIFTESTAFLMKDHKIVGAYKIPSHNTVTCMTEMEGTLLTMVFDNKKICTINLANSKVHINDDEFDGDILSIMHGSDNITWVGIDGVGVLEFYDENLLFENRFPHDMENSVLSLIEIEDNKVVAGTMGDGLFIADSEGLFRKARASGSFRSDYVFNISRSNSGDILFCGYDQIGVLKSISGDNLVIDKICDISGKGYTIFMDEKRENIWVGTFTQLMKIPFTRKGKSIVASAPQTFACKDAKGRDLDFSRSMNIIGTDNGDQLLVGVTGNGIFFLDLDTEQLIGRASIDEGNLSDDNVLTMRLSPQGKLLVGTSYGLNVIYFDKDGNVVKEVYKDESGLVDNSIHSLLEDGNGGVWVSTNKGIAKIDLKTKEIQGFLNSKFQSNEFCNSSCTKSSDGTMWFGGTRGCDSFKPENISKRSNSPTIIIRDMVSQANTIHDFNTGHPVILKHNDNFFTVSFGAMEYVRGKDCEYKYMLKGLQDSWSQAGTSRSASFTNVPPGRYTFMVSSTNGDKEWSDNIASFDILVRKPWWTTNLAIFFYLILAILLAYIFNKFLEFRIEEKHKLEMAELEKEKQAENYEGKLNFFTNLAHEFGTPLTLISTSSEQLMDDHGLQPSSGRYAKVIHKSARRMQGLISELVEFRKIESGNYPMKYSHVDVRALVEGILEDFKDSSLKKSVNVTKDVSDEDMLITTDSGALERILYNLLSNAYKYVTLYGDILLKAERYGNGVQFVVMNSSSRGIKAKDISKVFDRYSILDTFEKQASNEVVHRNGLGLAIVKDLVDLLHGTIKVESEENKNVKFTCFIPDEKDMEVAEEAETTLDYSHAKAMIDDDDAIDGEETRKTGLTVMVVEDDKDLRSMISDILQGTYEVLKASDGQEAMEMMNFEHPDLVISDIMMPNMDGLELLQKLRASEATRLIPVVFLTFKTDLESEMKALEMGADAFIHKPFHRRQLVTVVGNILRRRSSLKSYYSSMKSNMDIYNGTQVMREDKDFIMKLTNCIEENILDEDMSLDYLAEKMVISKMTLYRKIKELTEKTPSEFINKVKINRAVHLLKTTKMTIQEVMYASGYNNKSYFYRKFAEQNNMTPKEFRENQS